MSSKKITQIAVEGVIGVGKTSLATAMAQRLDAHLLSEDELANPFLGRFYQQRSRWAFTCQMQFLDQRLRQFADCPDDGKMVIADHTIEKELLFAQVVMSADELAVYERYFTRLAVDCAFNPQVVVYLIAEIPTLIHRIRERGRDVEGAIDTAYLEQLHHTYHPWFTGRHGDPHRRVVVVDADGSFIAREAAALDRLIEACENAPAGLSYCNPTG
jgi:deoxyadenosine/deoxycytidine kinase